MAKNWVVQTDSAPEQVLAAFSEVFFQRPKLKERFKVSKGAQLRSQQVWEKASAEGADLAAVLVRGGLREAAADSKRGPGSGLGTVVAVAVGAEGGRTVAQFWLANQNTFLGMGQQGDLLKAYAKLIAKNLADAGSRVEVGKV